MKLWSTRSFMLVLIVLALIAIYLYLNSEAMLVLLTLPGTIQNTFISPRYALPKKFTPVLTTGTKIQARTEAGVLRIECLDYCKRKYSWRSSQDNNWNEAETTLRPRDQSNNVLYDPGYSGENLSRLSKLSPTVIALEATEDCQDLKQLKKVLEIYQNQGYHKCVHTNSGLLVGMAPGGGDFLVVQFRLRGQCPKDLAGSSDSSIIITKAP